MNPVITPNRFSKELLIVLEETFEHVHGIYLDRGTSMLETLAAISPEQASQPVGQGCASIAAQVTHVCFYLDVLLRFLESGQNEQADWGEVWRTVRAVNPEEWAALQARLSQAYARTRAVVEAFEHWEMEDSLAGAIGMVAHCAYHLGEIRQATCTVKG